MKTMRKAFAMLLALVMILGLGVTAFAAEENYSITVTNTPSSTNVSIVGEAFYAYKIFDVTYTEGTHEETVDGKTVTVKDSYAYKISKDSSWFDVVTKYLNGQNGSVYTGKGMTLTPTASDSTVYNVTIDNKTFSARDFADYLGKWLNGEETKPAADGNGTGAAAGTDQESAVINLNNPGYYLVTGESKADEDQIVVAAAALYTTEPMAELKLKADGPTIEKKIVEDGKTTDANNAAVGDTVNYQVTSKVPNMTGYNNYFFVVNDTMSKGLTFNGDVAIQIGETKLTADKYEVTSTKNETTGETAIEIVLKKFTDYKRQAGANITITYSGTVNKDAVIGTAGNPNDVTLTYSSNPNVNTDGDKPKEDGTDPTGTTPKSEVRTYVTGIRLNKINNESPAMPLKGATFKIEGTALNTVLVSKEAFEVNEAGEYWKLKDGTYTTQDPNTTGIKKDQYASTTVKYQKTTTYTETKQTKDVSYEGTVGDDGVLCFNGLSAGDYTITEIKAPDGYNLLTSPLKLTIDWKAPTTDSSTDCTWTVENDSTNGWTADGGIFTINVVNQTGAILPSTGGIGTTIFYVVGSVLVIGALVLLVVRKKMSAYQDE